MGMGDFVKWSNGMSRVERFLRPRRIAWAWVFAAVWAAFAYYSHIVFTVWVFLLVVINTFEESQLNALMMADTEDIEALREEIKNLRDELSASQREFGERYAESGVLERRLNVETGELRYELESALKSLSPLAGGQERLFDAISRIDPAALRTHEEAYAEADRPKSKRLEWRSCASRIACLEADVVALRREVEILKGSDDAAGNCTGQG